MSRLSLGPGIPTWCVLRHLLLLTLLPAAAIHQQSNKPEMNGDRLTKTIWFFLFNL